MLLVLRLGIYSRYQGFDGTPPVTAELVQYVLVSDKPRVISDLIQKDFPKVPLTYKFWVRWMVMGGGLSKTLTLPEDGSTSAASLI